MSLAIAAPIRPARRRVVATLTALTCLTGVALAGCGGGADAKDASANEELCPNGKLRMGIEPFEDPQKITKSYQALAKSLGDKIGCKVEVTVVQNYAAEVLAMKNKQLELGQFGPMGLVFAQRQANAQPFVSFGDDKGKLTTYNAAIWVKKDSPIKTVEDLRGKQMALSEPGSTSGDAFPRYAIRKAGMQDSDVKIKYAGGHPQALLALKNGKVEAAEINTQQQATATEAGDFDASQYRRIWESENIPNDPIALSPDVSPKLKDALAKAVKELPKADVEQATKLLGLEKAGTLVPVTDKDYQPLADLADELGLTEKDL